MKKINNIVLILLLIQSAFAGHNGLTHAAALYCGKKDITESVSWDKTRYHWLRVAGKHFVPGSETYTHVRQNRNWAKKDGGFEYTWRCNATCTRDRANYDLVRFMVYSHHHVKTDTGKGTIAHEGLYGDCKAYDGWWDV